MHENGEDERREREYTPYIYIHIYIHTYTIITSLQTRLYIRRTRELAKVKIAVGTVPFCVRNISRIRAQMSVQPRLYVQVLHFQHC